jgi:mono/diheme cytochrome c family protein/plastocyanin
LVKKMNKETLARILVIVLVAAAAAIPLAGYFLTPILGVKTIELHARMAENGGWSPDTIQAVVGQPVHLRLTSDDVMHSFAIGKSDQAPIDIVPGEMVETTLNFDKPGTYTFYCTHWCGANHWRMRGTIEVSGPGPASTKEPQPLFLKLGLDVDMVIPAEVTPAALPSSGHGAQFASLLPAYATAQETYLTSSPAQLWQRLRAEPGLASVSDTDLWDAVAFAWLSQTSPEKLAAAQKLYSTNCAACHGEAGKGDGVMVRGLPVIDYQNHQAMAEQRVRPPDFTDPKNLLGTSPALLEGKMIRGGMGTGMPYWGPIFTQQQLGELVSYIYTFVLK